MLVLAEVLGRPEVLGQGDPRLLDDPPELDGVEGGAAARREVRDLHQLQGEALVLGVKDRRHLGEEDSITRVGNKEVGNMPRYWLQMLLFVSLWKKFEKWAMVVFGPIYSGAF